MPTAPTQPPRPPTTTGNGLYAECSKFCRVTNHGHSANKLFAECRPQALGKLRANGIFLYAECRNSTKIRHSVYNLFVECCRDRTRQHWRTCPPSTPVLRQPSNRLTTVSVCRVPARRHSAKPYRRRVPFAGTWQCVLCRVPKVQHSAKIVYAECLRAGTQQTFLFFKPFAFQIFLLSYNLKSYSLLIYDTYQFVYYILSFYFVCGK